jgi:hypothetical protein
MGKIILEFDSIEESQDARVALDAMRWKMSMWDLDQKLRSTTKYGQSVIHSESEADESEQNIAEKYRDIIREILDDYNLNLED